MQGRDPGPGQECPGQAAAAADVPHAADFQVLKQFRRDRRKEVRADESFGRSRLRLSDERWFPTEHLPDRLARALCRHRALPFKELLEAFEFFGRIRRRVRGSTVIDLCCGHGLAGLLQAVFERRVERVVLVDRARPPSFDRLLEAVGEVAPWAPPKVDFVTSRMERLDEDLFTGGCALLGVHACGLRTDRILDLAIAHGHPVAVLPCCRPHRRHPAPRSLRNALGADKAIDVHRTYLLENAGFRVRWDAIPAAITPRNRILMAVPRASEPAPASSVDSGLMSTPDRR